MLVFVQYKHGEAIMPCKLRKARLLLKEKKAKIISYKPFTIQLLYGSSGYKQKIHVGVDLGTKYTGIAMTSQDKVLVKGEVKGNESGRFKIKQFRKKKRSLHEATARKGRKTANVTSKRNEKNTKKLKGFYLNDQVEVYGKVGFITGFTGASGAYIKTIEDEYIQKPNKTYKQINLKELVFVRHNNNWQFVNIL